MKGLVQRVVDLTDEETRNILDAVFVEFRERHRSLEEAFRLGYERVKIFLPPRSELSKVKRLLLGSYFTCEYSLEAAALFNPSIVPHHDQSGLAAGALRFIMSLRATGEGHISSIEFRTGVIDKKGDVSMDAAGNIVTTPTVNPDPVFIASEFFSKLQDGDRRSSSMKEIVKPLPAKFTRSQLAATIARLKKRGAKLSAAQRRAVEALESLLELNYEIVFSAQVPLSERAIFPVSSFESNGIEDARFVRFTDDDGAVTYYSTYTAITARRSCRSFLRQLILSVSGSTRSAGTQQRTKGWRFSRGKSTAGMLWFRGMTPKIFILFSRTMFITGTLQPP